jgi:hypothetical protein
VHGEARNVGAECGIEIDFKKLENLRDKAYKHLSV